MDAATLRRLLKRQVPPKAVSAAKLRPASVLVALEPGRGVWLTRRSLKLSSHAGQVAFPGGKIERSDASPEAAALREAEEEIGLDPAQAEILGRMDDYVTGTGFHISSVLALVPEHVALTPDPGEVAELFCLPFPALLDPGLPQKRSALFGTPQRFDRGLTQRGEPLRGGLLHSFYVWPHDEHVIWGATGEILYRLARRLRGEA
jgi:8-oxo-dGTP pyrophosphatase MutT (NUDIX family)